MSLKVVISILSIVTLVSCADTKSSSLYLSPTVYYKPSIYLNEKSCSASDSKDLVGLSGQVLETLCKKDYDNCLLQGSCFVYDNDQVKSYNYHSRRDGVPRFVQVDLDECPFGYGVKNSCLDPYFSIAADLSIYSLGDVIFVPRVVGVEMPNGEIHDGFFIIRDSGGSIKGVGRFDFFTGLFSHRDSENTLSKLGFSDSNNKFEFRMATQDETLKIRENRRFPQIKMPELSN